MESKTIQKQMYSLEKLIHYHFNQISWLAKAMKSVLIEVCGEGKNHKEYSNEGLATVGDTILKSVIADKLYRDGVTTKGEITDKKSKLENNEIMHRMVLTEGIINYAYNNIHFYGDPNIPDHEQVVCKEHDPYIEAIVGAVYYDSDFDTTKGWILKWLIPILKKYEKENENSNEDEL